MKNMQKDFDLFAAYKSTSNKTVGNKSAKGLVVMIVLFVLIVGGAYGTLKFFDYSAQLKIAQVRESLSAPAVLEAQTKLAASAKLNELMTQYKIALTMAQKNFDASMVIDASILEQIAQSTPDDVTISGLTITPQAVGITCVCTDPLAPAVFTQALHKKDLFLAVSYSGITLEGDGTYTFTLNCTFKEVTAE